MRSSLFIKPLITSILVWTSLQSGSAAITDGLVAHWAFDETSGSTVLDSSTSGSDGQITNAEGDEPVWVSGIIGNALNLRGPNAGSDYVTVGAYPKPTVTFSISAWVWNDARDGTWPQSTIIESSSTTTGPFGLVIRPKNRDQAFGPLGNTSSDFTARITLNDTIGFPTDKWEHVGLVADGAQIRLYRNGVQIGAADYGGEFPEATGAALGIGATLDESGTATGAYWQGKIDDIGIWSSALSTAQMASIYTAGLAGKDLTKADDFVNTKPTISTPPQSITRYVGESAVFTVKAAGSDPITYQWKHNSVNLPGATSATLSFASVKISDAGQYIVTVSNPGGNIESTPVTLTVLSAGLNTGLIGYWRFDETEGTSAADSSSGNHPGTLGNYSEGSPSWSEGVIGGSLQFGSSSKQYVLVEDYAKPASTLTVSAWVFADSLGPWASFVKNWGSSDAGQFHFGIFADGIHQNIYIKQTDGKTPNVSDPDPFPTGEWQHVAVVCDGSKVRLYRQGVEVASTDYDGTLVLPPMNCIGIGAKLQNNCSGPDTGAPGFWNGKMDDVGLWNRGLSPEEIQSIYQKGQIGKGIGDTVITDGLIGYYPLDETSGTTAADASLGGHPGTLGNYSEGSPSWSEGVIGGSLQFGSSSKQYVVVEDYSKPASTLTVSAWVFADSLGPWASFVKNWGSSDAGQFHFGIFADGIHQNIYIKQSDGKTPNVSDPDPFPIGEWQHVAVVCDGSKVRLYRQGVEVASTDYDGTLVLPPMNCIGIGAKLQNNCSGPDTGAPGYWNGRMDDIGIWNRGLSPDEISSIYQAGLSAQPLTAANGTPRARLSIQRVENQVILSWDQSGYSLEENTDLSNPAGWSTVGAGGPSPVAITIESATSKFYRLSKP